MQETFLWAQHHKESLAICCIDFCTMVEDLATWVLRNFDLFYLVLQQVVIQKGHKDDFFAWSLSSHGHVATCDRCKQGHPCFRLRISLWAKVNVAHSLPKALLTSILFLFLVWWLFRLALFVIILVFLFSSLLLLIYKQEAHIIEIKLTSRPSKHLWLNDLPLSLVSSSSFLEAFRSPRFLKNFSKPLGGSLSSSFLLKRRPPNLLVKSFCHPSFSSLSKNSTYFCCTASLVDCLLC